METYNFRLELWNFPFLLGFPFKKQQQNLACYCSAITKFRKNFAILVQKKSIQNLEECWKQKNCQWQNEVCQIFSQTKSDLKANHLNQCHIQKRFGDISFSWSFLGVL